MNLRELKMKYNEYYEVFIEVIGSRMNGSFLVKAPNKRAAKKFVRDLNDNYVTRGECVNAIVAMMAENGDINEDFPDLADPVIDAEIRQLSDRHNDEKLPVDLTTIPYGVIVEIEFGT